jgi:hypothetical protein
MTQISSEQDAAEEQLCVYAKVLFNMGVSVETIHQQIDSALAECEPRKIKMYCWSCEKETEFEDSGDGEGPVCECGHYQKSYAQGAAEICEMATWHDLNAYKETAAIAKAGGYEVPAEPNYFAP